jgi:hypothetical protein
MAVGSRTSFYGSTNDFNKILLAENGGSVVSHQIYRVIYVHLDIQLVVQRERRTRLWLGRGINRSRCGVAAEI